MKRFMKFYKILPIFICLVFSISSYIGWWIPTAFGTGTLWLVIGALVTIWAWNESVEEETNEEQ